MGSQGPSFAMQLQKCEINRNRGKGKLACVARRFKQSERVEKAAKRSLGERQLRNPRGFAARCLSPRLLLAASPLVFTARFVRNAEFLMIILNRGPDLDVKLNCRARVNSQTLNTFTFLESPGKFSGPQSHF